ncbi:hypothetical protein AMECASPLE_002363 [Ameca splendens]|uniref:Uncharacterized protein n=1 Tax=Ameca splendens TaxID=208324 RepID=A0ABV0XMD3_9TELE
MILTVMTKRFTGTARELSCHQWIVCSTSAGGGGVKTLDKKGRKEATFVWEQCQAQPEIKSEVPGWSAEASLMASPDCLGHEKKKSLELPGEPVKLLDPVNVWGCFSLNGASMNNMWD